MARNSEKQLTGLNRFLLEQQRIDKEEKAPSRPPLHTLKTADEVRRWIPQIKNEIGYVVQQLSGVRNYRDHKLREFEDRLEDLEHLYARFVRRVLQLDPSSDAIPWVPRSYVRRTQRVASATTTTSTGIDSINDDGVNDEAQRNSTKRDAHSLLDNTASGVDAPPAKIRRIVLPLLDAEENDALAVNQAEVENTMQHPHPRTNKDNVPSPLMAARAIDADRMDKPLEFRSSVALFSPYSALQTARGHVGDAKVVRMSGTDGCSGSGSQLPASHVILPASAGVAVGVGTVSAIGAIGAPSGCVTAKSVPFVAAVGLVDYGSDDDGDS